MAVGPSQEATQILDLLSGGDRAAVDKLMPLVYEQLHALAEHFLVREPPSATLQPTALVHEAFLKLIDQTRVQWQSRAHFLAVAAQAMRRVLLDHWRGKQAAKRGGQWRRVTLDEDVALSRERDLDGIALDEALTELGALDERQGQVVLYRFFGGMTNDEVAHVLGVSTRTVEDEWRMARAWLHRHLSASKTA